MTQKQKREVRSSVLQATSGASPSAASQGSPRARYDVGADSVVVKIEASDGSPVRANTQSRTFTIAN